jgi:hypothetical protein
MATRPQDRGIQETTLGSAALSSFLAAHNDLERINRQRSLQRFGFVPRRSPPNIARFPDHAARCLRIQPQPFNVVRWRRRLVMNNNRKSHRTAMAIFAVILAAAVIAAFVTVEHDTKQARNVAQPGTIGLAHAHPPLDRAPGEPIRN